MPNHNRPRSCQGQDVNRQTKTMTLLGGGGHSGGVHTCHAEGYGFVNQLFPNPRLSRIRRVLILCPMAVENFFKLQDVLIRQKVLPGRSDRTSSRPCKSKTGQTLHQNTPSTVEGSEH